MSVVTAVRNAVGRKLGYGGCYRCGGTWDYTEVHMTYYSSVSGCFPLCESCWSELSPQERLPYYATLVGKWTSGDTGTPLDRRVSYLDEWVAIKTAVLEGK